MGRLASLLLLLLAACEAGVDPASTATEVSLDTPDLVESWIAALDSDERQTRKQAFVELGKIGAPAAEALRPLLRDPLRREAALQALLLMDADALPARAEVTGCLTDARMFVRWSAVRILSNLGPDARPAIPALADALWDSVRSVRVEAADTLGRLGADAAPAIPDLIALFERESDEPEYVRDDRIAAIAALMKIGHAAHPALRKLVPVAARDSSKWVREAGRDASVHVFPWRALRDEDPEMRRGAIETLSGRDLTKEEAARIVPLVLDSDAGVHNAARKYATQWGEPAVPVLEALLDTDDARGRLRVIRTLAGLDSSPDDVAELLAPLLDSADPEVRRRAVQVAGDIGPQARPLSGRIVELLDDGKTGAVAATALGSVGDETIAPALAAHLDDEAWLLTCNCLNSLGDLGAKAAAAAPAIRRFGRASKDSVLRFYAEVALVRIGGPEDEAVDRLLEVVLTGDDWEDRYGALTALRRLGPLARRAIPVLESLSDRDDRDVEDTIEQLKKACREE